MARSEQLEAILRAQYELEYAEPEDLSRRLERLNTLLDEATHIIATRLAFPVTSA